MTRYLTIDNLLSDLREYVENPDALTKEAMSMTVLFALREIGSSAVGVAVTKRVRVIDHSAKFPADLLRLKDIKTEAGEGMYEVPLLDTVLSRHLEYVHLQDEVQVTWKTGELIMIYYALPTDKDNYPLIAEEFYEAVLHYALSRQKMKQTFANKGLSRADLQMQVYLDRTASEAIARARGNHHTNTRGRSRTINQKNGRFFKK